MKNVLLSILLIFLFKISTQAQPNQSCSNAEKILIDERPEPLSAREAYTVITGEKPQITLRFNKTYCSQNFNKWGLSDLNAYEKKRKVFVTKTEGSSLAQWGQSSAYFVFIEKTQNWQFWGFSIGVFVLAFSFGLFAINFFSGGCLKWGYSFNKEVNERSRIIKVGAVVSLLIGLIAYAMYYCSIKDDLIDGATFQFSFIELIILPISSFIGGLLYLGICSLNEILVEYTSKKKALAVT